MGRSVGRSRHGSHSALGCGKIARNLIFRYVVDDDFKEDGILTRIELHGLIEALVLLLDVAVVCTDDHRVLRALVVYLLGLEFDGGEEHGLGTLLESELVVGAVAAVLELFQFVVGASDEAAHHAGVAHGALQLGLRGVEVLLGVGDAGFSASDIGLDGGDIGGNCSDLLSSYGLLGLQPGGLLILRFDGR